MNSIFPGLVPDIDNVIIFHMDNDCQVTFSGVSRKAYELLYNGVYFANLFKLQHAVLTKHGFKFEVLTRCHPSNCWKAACCAGVRAVFKVKDSFLRQAIPFLREPLEAKKLKLEFKLKEICGNFPSDPESPIDEAWQSKARCQHELEDVCSRHAKQMNEIRQIFSSFYSPDDYCRVFNLCGNRCDDFFVNEEGGLGDFSEEELKIIHSEFIPHYRVTTNFYKEFNFWQLQFCNQNFSYETLERERSRLATELHDVNEELAQLASSSTETLSPALAKHGLSLEKEYIEGLRREAALTCLPLLAECSALIFAIIVDDPEATPETLSSIRIRSLINSCNCWQSTEIWKKLYFKCADGIIEDQWSEKHFPKFLRNLRGVIINEYYSRKGEFRLYTGKEYKKAYILII